ncbi:MAG: TraR/DksA family transcriptional regulator [Dissulfurispiraceae bacterium]
MKSQQFKKTPNSEDARRDTLRRMLLRNRDEVVQQGKRDLRNALDGDGKSMSGDEADMASNISIDLMRCNLSDRQRETLLAIDDALGRLSLGAYGICEECGEPILEGRLMAIPFATCCTDCQGQKEIATRQMSIAGAR